MAAGMNTVATFFDFGDTPDSGYQRTYTAIGGRIRRIRGEDGGKRYFIAGMHYPAHHLNIGPGVQASSMRFSAY